MQTAYDSNNIFAKIIRSDIPCHRVFEDDKTLAFMDVMPQARGHVLIVPKCEAVELSDMDADYLTAVFTTAQKIMAAQRRVLHCKGIIQMQLNGEQAGQSVFHYHVHLIPGNVHEIGKHEDHMADQAELSALAKQLREALAG